MRDVEGRELRIGDRVVIPGVVEDAGKGDSPNVVVRVRPMDGADKSGPIVEVPARIVKKTEARG